MHVKVIGCGGIGSYLAEHIDRLIELDQIDNNKMNFTFYDDDDVEMKNMLYQNFITADIDSLKTEALMLRYYNVIFEEKRLTTNDLENCGLVVLCADNNKIRKQAFEAWTKWKIPFIDSRANGRAIGIFSSDTENYLNTISDDEKSSSCQNPFQLAKKEIEYGNVVIAAALAQVILNYSRNGNLPPDFMVNL